MGRKLLLGIGIPVLLIAALALGAYLWIRAPVDTQSYRDPVSADGAEQSTALTAALVAGGMKDAFVDVAPEQAYVAYERPEGTSDPSDWQWFVLGAAADTVDGPERLVVVQYVDDAPSLSWSVPMADLHAFADGTLDADALERRIDVEHHAA